MEINVQVRGQKLRIPTNYKGYAPGSQKFVRFVFDLSDDWDGLSIFAQFSQNGVGYNQYLDAENTAYLPHEIVTGQCSLMLYGTYGSGEETVIATTNCIILTVCDDYYISDANSTEISESLYTQLANKVDKAESLFTGIEERVDEIEESLLETGKLRCSENLTSPGWYRALRYTGNSNNAANGYGGSQIDLVITRMNGANSSENHSISFHLIEGLMTFDNEHSISGSLCIDQVRYSRNENIGYIDIHYSASESNVVTVDYDIHDQAERQALYIAESLQAVGDAPDGETVIMTYKFTENGPLNLREGGLGAAFGKYAEEDNLLDVAWNERVHGVLDVVPRRCYGALSSAGWYRVLTYTASNAADTLGDHAFHVELTILDMARQAHKITFYGILGALRFGGEESVSSASNFVDKIRYTTSGTYGYIDIHYIGGDRSVAVSFNVFAARLQDREKFVAQSLQAVADVPSGETIQVSYDLTTDGIRTVTLTSMNSAVTINAQSCKRIGNVVSLWVRFTVSSALSGYQLLVSAPTAATNITALTYNGGGGVSNEWIYADAGNVGLRCMGSIAAGTYVCYVSYITTDV